MREPDEWWRQAQPLILQIFVCLDFLCSFFPIGLTLSLHYFESFYLLFSLCFAIFCIRCFLLFYLSVPLYLFILLFSNILLPRFLFFVLHSVYVHLNVVLRINPLPAIYFPIFSPGFLFLCFYFCSFFFSLFLFLFYFFWIFIFLTLSYYFLLFSFLLFLLSFSFFCFLYFRLFPSVFSFYPFPLFLFVFIFLFSCFVRFSGIS